MQFSTMDRDNDLHPKSCAQMFKGAWWYEKCHASNLNGHYYKGGNHASIGDGADWQTWKGLNYSAMKTAMRIRPQ